jgi:hypothetical protein
MKDYFCDTKLNSIMTCLYMINLRHFQVNLAYKKSIFLEVDIEENSYNIKNLTYTLNLLNFCYHQNY